MIRTHRPARPGIRLPAAMIVAALLVGACGQDATSAPSARTPVPSSADAASPKASPTAGPTATPDATEGETVTLTVLAASSLTDAMVIVRQAYVAESPGVDLAVSFGGSNGLRAQVERGAPADVFLSADTDNAAALVDRGLTIGTEQVFAGNTLALIVPRAGARRVSKLLDLAAPGVRIAGAAAGVPISVYSTAFIEEVGRIKGFPAGYALSVERNISGREDNVRAVLARVRRGEADAGFVYATDAASATADVETVRLPDSLNLPTTYAGVVIATSTHADVASAFLAWLSSSNGQAALERAGLLPPVE